MSGRASHLAAAMAAPIRRSSRRRKTGTVKPLHRERTSSAVLAAAASGVRLQPSLDRHDIDGDAELLPRRADDDAVDRRNVGKIAPHCENDVIVLDQEVIGRIETDPAKFGPAP